MDPDHELRKEHLPKWQIPNWLILKEKLFFQIHIILVGIGFIDGVCFKVIIIRFRIGSIKFNSFISSIFGFSAI